MKATAGTQFSPHPAATADGSVALLVDGDGLAIDASDPTLAAEIDRVNASAGAAVLYYRSAGGMETITSSDAVASSSAETNALVERVLAESDEIDV